MEYFWILICVSLFASNSLDKAKSVKVKLEETPLKTFDEIFGEGWLDKGEAKDLKTPAPTNFGQNVHHQIDRQNTQLGQIESNSTDQLGQIDPNSTDQLGQIEPNSTDQNAPLTESDHSGQIEPNSTDQNPPHTEADHSENAKNGEEITSNEKRKIINKFLSIKDEFKQKRKHSKKEWVQIDNRIAKHLKVNRSKIYKWKNELGISRKMHNIGKEKEERKHLVEKFDQKKAELTRDGFKNSYPNQINEIVAKELGITDRTIYSWKRELGQTHSHSEQKDLMKRYYKIKDKKPKISDENIAKMLKIGTRTLVNWKKQFNRQQFHANFFDGHSVAENAAENFEEIGNSNSGNI